MIRKRYNDQSGNWHIDVFVDGEWVEIGQESDEDQVDRVIATLTSWLMESTVENPPDWEKEPFNES